MKKLLSALFVLALCSSMAAANVPYSSNCVVSPCDALNGAVVCPDQPTVLTQTVVNMTIRNQANNPIPGAAVNLTFLNSTNLCICNTMIFNGTTDNSGKLTMTLRAGGCLNGVDQALVIRANATLVRNFKNVKSPDWDGVAGNCVVNLSDIVRFAPQSDLCFDFDNSGVVDLGDVVIFAAGYNPAHFCTKM